MIVPVPMAPLVFNREAFLLLPRPSTGDRREATSLYIIRSESYCKVGIANNVTKRLEAFRAGNPHELKLVRAYPYSSRLHALLVERTVHRVLAAYSIGREWFHVDPKLAQSAASCVSSAMRVLARGWEKADADSRREVHHRYLTDPEFRARMDAEENSYRSYKHRTARELEATDAFIEQWRSENSELDDTQA